MARGLKGKGMTTTYQAFLKNKHVRLQRTGFDIPLASINSKLFDWQRVIVQWACKCGRAALFEDCGLGKTAQQLEWSRLVHQQTSGDVLLLCPIAVQWQTKREAGKFGIECPVNVVETNDQVQPGISITNYEKLHHFDTSRFTGVVLDESSILKAYTGATKRALCKQFAGTPYRLACTATPAPNDRMELGNHSEFLGVMPSNDMLARWFINDGGKAGTYRLRKHGECDFWRWMASWAVCISTPDDIGFDGSMFNLPELLTFEHVVESKPQPGYLFAVPQNVSATNVHREKRASLEERADEVAKMVNGDPDCWAVWCDTDYEADALIDRIKDAVEVRGSHSEKIKESRLRAFSDGEARVIVTKPEIGGFGLNWQHCHKTTWFAGYSYERFYQSIRRLWRFGQTHDVEVHVIRTTNEGSIVEAIERKKQQHAEMQREMAGLMGDGMREELGFGSQPRKYHAERVGSLPSWLIAKG
jgi:hypothetical protein